MPVGRARRRLAGNWPWGNMADGLSRGDHFADRDRKYPGTVQRALQVAENAMPRPAAANTGTRGAHPASNGYTTESSMSPLPLLSDPAVDAAELARRIAKHDEAAFECVMRRHNGALYRVARAILKNNADAEDVLQEAYLSAYRHMAQFRADAKLSTWLTRIVVNQALARRRSQHRSRVVVPFSHLHAHE